ncbi:MAG: hypothetical protein ACOX4I_02875 [Anaerovoracaceae bacterium]
MTPDQLTNVYNCIKLPLTYQVGDHVVTQIPLLMAVYAAVTILLIPLTYFSYKRYRYR